VPVLGEEDYSHRIELYGIFVDLLDYILYIADVNVIEPCGLDLLACLELAKYINLDPPPLSIVSCMVRGESKIKLKNVNKKRMATARRLIFFEFSKASIAYLITLLFSS
jgi:hypothetical protein